MQELSDNEIVERYLKGDEEALEVWKQLTNLLLQRHNIANPQLANFHPAGKVKTSK